MISVLAMVATFSQRHTRSKGGSGTALRLNLNQVITLRSNETVKVKRNAF